MECSCWNDGLDIVQGDVNIESYDAGASGIAYIADLITKRGPNNDVPFSAQGVATFDHYAVGVLLSRDNLHNFVYVMDLSNYTITAAQTDKLTTGYHWNSATVLQSVSGLYEIGFAAHGLIQSFWVTASGQFTGTPSGQTIVTPLYLNGISADGANLYVSAGGKVYTAQISGGTLVTSEIFDTASVIGPLAAWIYPGWVNRRQEMEVHNGVVYLTYSHPNTVFRYGINGVYLGSTTIPYTSQGHPCCEVEALAWSEYYHCFIMQTQGRTTDDYDTDPTPGLYGRAYLWAWGGSGVDNWRLEYSTQNGDPSNVQAASTKYVYATASAPGTTPAVGDVCRRTGIVSEPFNLISDALFMCAELENNSSREECHLILSGDFAAYENGNYAGNGLTVQIPLRVVFNSNNTKIPRVNISNSSATSFLLNSSETGCQIKKLRCSVNSKVTCLVPCPEIEVYGGAEFTGNNIGATKLTVSSMGIARFGGTNNSFLAGSSMATNAIIITPSSVDMSNVSGYTTTSLSQFGVGQNAPAIIWDCVAGNSISAGNAVNTQSSDPFTVYKPSSTSAYMLGIALNNAAVGERVRVAVWGLIPLNGLHFTSSQSSTPTTVKAWANAGGNINVVASSSNPYRTAVVWSPGGNADGNMILL